MKANKLKVLPILLLCIMSVVVQAKQSSKPNIIYILADDLGYGDLSCYGQKKFQTPNIDGLAQKGMRFTQHYSGSTVCAPSRCSLMTGKHTGHAYIRGNKEIQPEGQEPIPNELLTIAEILKQQGYATGAFGKWGLGFPGSEGDPNNQGFDLFYGYNCQRIGHNYYPYSLWENQQKVELTGNSGSKEEEYAPNLIHDKTLTFIEENKDQPFFAYVASIIPHAELKVPEDYLKQFSGKYGDEKPYKGCDFGCQHYKIGGYGSQSEPHATFAAMVKLLDDQVGEIIQKCEELGIAENTIIIFTSDNGPHLEGGADPDFFDSNTIYRGYKRDLYEGGIRVPMIVSWPGKIKAGTVSNHISAFWDVLPTFCEIINTEIPKETDGISFLPELFGKKQKEHKAMYWEFPAVGGRQAIRMGKWKAVRYDLKKNPDAAIQLFNLEVDPQENNNVASENPQIIKKMEELFKTSRTESAIFSLF